MLDDVGTSCATTNATPETSFAPRHGVDAPPACTGNRPIVVRGRIQNGRTRTERAGALPVIVWLDFYGVAEKGGWCGTAVPVKARDGPGTDQRPTRDGPATARRP
ncbi:hypothetical protein, partial [Streptomyces kebangsaanensis]|uniref:hypothetical protein n=1 Tax=Streptomyces kebangsaanensis TaxID=864058 RepID=UPI001F4792BE